MPLSRGFLGEFDGVVSRVVDGDTFDCVLNLGLGLAVTVRIRILGINAPESQTAAGKAATVFAKTLLPENLVVRVEAADKDKFGRVLAEVFKADGTNVSKAMLDAGHAVLFGDFTLSGSVLSPFIPPTPNPIITFFGGISRVFIGGKLS